jgi:hypothetical protein
MLITSAKQSMGAPWNDDSHKNKVFLVFQWDYFDPQMYSPFPDHVDWNLSDDEAYRMTFS